jgi:tetratricopeptide (TPR) repeat protein
MPFAAHRPTAARRALRILTVLALLWLVAPLHGQTLTWKARYDSLGTRYDKSRPLIERYFIHANHGAACFNRGLVQEQRANSIEQFAIAEQLGLDTLLSQASNNLGDALVGSSDVALQLKYYYQALDYAERSGSAHRIGTAQKQIATVYRSMGDIPRAMELLKLAITNVRDDYQRARTSSGLSVCYLMMGQPDSALYWAQRSNIIPRPEDDPQAYAHAYYNLGAAYAAKGERALADVHFARAIEVSDSFRLVIPLFKSLVARGRMTLDAGDISSALADGRRALQVSRDGSNVEGTIAAADLLRRAHKAAGHSDSAYHYFEQRVLYADSLRSTDNLNKLQNLAFAQELKEREEAKAKAAEAAARSHNIQFGIIALIVITLGIFLLIFSRTSVVGAKAIKNLSLIALLLFFEFINLLLHPVLDRITNHSPILMLLCMAAIAGLLIPLHHRMEHFITNMLVSKNNRVRLEAARRTIEELEGSGKE